MKRWQDDDDFKGWLTSVGYAKEVKGSVKPCLSDGLVLYMWEAWKAGKRRGGAS